MSRQGRRCGAVAQRNPEQRRRSGGAATGTAWLRAGTGAQDSWEQEQMVVGPSFREVGVNKVPGQWLLSRAEAHPTEEQEQEAAAAAAALGWVVANFFLLAAAALSVLF